MEKENTFNEEQMVVLEESLADRICELGNRLEKRFNEYLGDSNEFKGLFKDILKETIEQYVSDLLENKEIKITFE